MKIFAFLEMTCVGFGILAFPANLIFNEIPIIIDILFLIIGGITASGIIWGAELVDKRKIKKQIKALKKSLEMSKSKKGNEKNSVKVAELSETVEKIKQEVINNQPIINAVTEELKKLRDKIQEIKNEKKKKAYAQELLGILGQYKMLANATEGNIHKKILAQLVSLTYRVDETLKEETMARENKEEFKKMIEEVDKKSRRAGGV